jgi:hypothetical protein
MVNSIIYSEVRQFSLEVAILEDQSRLGGTATGPTCAGTQEF